MKKQERGLSTPEPVDHFHTTHADISVACWIIGSCTVLSWLVLYDNWLGGICDAVTVMRGQRKQDIHGESVNFGAILFIGYSATALSRG